VAEIAPLKTMRYAPEVAGDLQTLISPPYDVIDAPMRDSLAGGNARNVVEIDLPEGAGDQKYANSAALIDKWLADGALVVEDEPAYWILRQEFEGPDGRTRARTGFFARVKVEDYGPGRIRPHERTHPGPKEDRLKLMHATKANLSPIFSLFSDEGGDSGPLLAAAAVGEPFAQLTDSQGIRNTLWRVADPQLVEQLTTSLAGKELLIADGHHRYETARTYAQQVGGEGSHNYVLMFLCALQDPGMAVFATHRLAEGTSPEQQEAINSVAKESFEIEEVALDDIAPPDDDDTLKCEFGYIDARNKQAYRLRLKDQAIADAALTGKPEPYRRLDTAILETLFLKGALGMTDDDISHLNGLWYSSELQEAQDFVLTGRYDLCFFLRPTPIQQIVEIAAAGENMPPKSTYFYPKVPTGLVFNPLT
jgi:uncharacterized protein (DUF1015 family)